MDAHRKLSEAEAAAQEKLQLAQEHKPVIDEHHRKVTKLTEEHDQYVKCVPTAFSEQYRQPVPSTWPVPS